MPFSDETIAFAASLGYAFDELPLISNGCSGGLSWLYALGDKGISIEQCCHRHDIAYQHGGTKKERKTADRRLRDCALEKAGENAFKKTRAWIVYGAVRVFGRPYWAGD